MSDASSTELYAGLYVDNKFPTSPEAPFEGFLRSPLMIAVSRSIDYVSIKFNMYLGFENHLYWARQRIRPGRLRREE